MSDQLPDVFYQMQDEDVVWFEDEDGKRLDIALVMPAFGVTHFMHFAGPLVRRHKITRIEQL